MLDVFRISGLLRVQVFSQDRDLPASMLFFSVIENAFQECLEGCDAVQQLLLLSILSKNEVSLEISRIFNLKDLSWLMLSPSSLGWSVADILLPLPFGHSSMYVRLASEYRECCNFLRLLSHHRNSRATSRLHDFPKTCARKVDAPL
jgi:hypothetical protein